MIQIKSSALKVAVLAGRRPDEANTETVRFPIDNIEKVKAELKQLFLSQKVTHLVCSAACGADLLALDIAYELAVESHIILPFSVVEFRKTSVVDRPGSWGEIYDKVVEKAQQKGCLHLLNYSTKDKDVFLKATKAIIFKTMQIAGHSPAFSIVVWEGQSRGEDDATQEFVTLCKEAGLYKIEVSTL